MSRPVVIAHLYPQELSTYGDTGNIRALVQRLAWRGFDVEVRPVGVGTPVDLAEVDLLFGGGGQDSGQAVVSKDLLQRGPAIREAALEGLPMLLICGSYQLFGRSFTTVTGTELPGIGVFDLTTVGSGQRMVGNIVLETEDLGRVVGFENHSGRTLLAPGQEPLGRVTKGFGNDEDRRFEGARTGACIGTYLHGPVLPKNPRLADHLLLAALRRRHGVQELAPLDDAVEQAAAATAASRPQ